MMNTRRLLRRTRLAVGACLTIVCGTAFGADVAVGSHKFTLPDGFEIEQVAGPPLVDRPISADFDEEGRLYVTDSSGSNEKVDVQLEKRPHRVVRLEDSDGDGRFDKSTVFADKMMFPEGALWHDGSLYVAAPPQIWKLTDSDGDGVAEHREVWFDGKTLTGCANDLHGPYLGPDGWIYWCKGAFAEQTYERPGRSPLVTRAAHIFRRRPEGGPIEPVMTGGMDNPVDVVFTPGGERIFSTTFFQHPGGGLRDGLIHAIYGGVYGKVHGVLDGHPRTGPMMPVLSHMGAAAPCGLVRLHSDQFGADFRDNLFACLFNMHKLTRHVLTPAGATFESRDADFLVSDNLDFHPTDVLEDADGSLIVVDTGGWYKLCCPTSQLVKPDVLGAVYRIRRTGAHKVDDPRGKKVDWTSPIDQQLVAILGNARFAVRDRARQQLLKNGDAAIVALDKAIKRSDDPLCRLEAVWTLTQINDPKVSASVRAALGDSDETVRQAALHSVCVRVDKEAETSVAELLKCQSAPNRRAAAEALGRIGSPRSVPALLAALSQPADRILEHSLIYALLEIGDVEQTRSALAHESLRVRQAALMVLDQLPGGNVQLSDVLPHLDSTDPAMQETAWWITERHREWAPNLAAYFREALAITPDGTEQLGKLSARLATFAADPTIQKVMADALTDANARRGVRLAMLSAMAASRQQPIPDAWAAAIQSLLATNDAELLEAAVGAVQTLSSSKPSDQFVGRLREMARDGNLAAAIRLKALVALPGERRALDETLLRFLCEQLDLARPVNVRALAVDVLVGSPVTIEQLTVVADAVANTGPMELKRLMELFAKHPDEQLGLRLVDALLRCAAASSLSPDEIKLQLAGYGDNVLQKLAPLLERIAQENSDKYRQLESILGLLAAGDIRRGQRVFQSTKAACASCHAMGYLGGRVGPDLTHIGKIRIERDLLESILFPSASFVRSYEPSTILTADGLLHNGIVQDETATELTLQIDAQKVVRVPVEQVELRKPGTVSVMPAGLEKQLTPQELADLVVFLKSAQ
ncbi:MAG: PVC-type heme-binding CxxCH protein [Planctomycetaceae bacterium]